MSAITTLTRNLLTRSFRPFLFRAEADARLPLEDCRNLGLYVHIPFCRKICSFCPYCKEPYEQARAAQYLDHLLQEIHLVGAGLTEKKTVSSLYFGGGSPALVADRLPEVLDALQQYFVIQEGVGLELHPSDVRPEILQKLRAAGVTKISIGIQSFGNKFLKLLGRAACNPAQLQAALAAVPFETVSMDFIFALPGQNFADLQADIDCAFAIGANHIAVYPFISFSFAQSGVPAMPKREKRALLDQLTQYCRDKGYRRDSIWTFAKEAGAGYSSMTRDTFLGFGCSATTLLQGQFKINTFSIAEYQARVQQGVLPTALTLRFTPRQRMLYYLFWTAYSTRVSAAAFHQFFGRSLKSQFGFSLFLAKRLGFCREEEGVYTLTDRGAFYFHYYENDYTLSYIDKMWSLLRHEAFPKELQF